MRRPKTPGRPGRGPRSDGPTPEGLARMALRTNASAEEIRRLFHRAGYGFLHDTLSAVGAKLDEELEDDPGDPLADL